MIETGLRASLSTESRAQIFNEMNQESGEYEIVDMLTDSFDFDENIYATYFIMRNKLGSFSYLAGLRGEYTFTESYHPRIDSVHENSYFNIFPSIFLTYEISDNQDLQFSYSRRIRRPSFSNMMPFYNAQDLFNLRYGNPYLQPEYPNSFELSYLRAWDRYLLTGSIFHRKTENAITRVFQLHEDEAAVVTWVNANTRTATGLEIVNDYSFTSNIDATLTANFFHSSISGKENGEAFENESYTWSLNLLGNIRIPDIVNIQLMGSYNGLTVLPQGHIEPRYGLNFGLRRSIMQNRGTLSLNVSDVFNTQNFVITTDGSGFSQKREFTRETRILTLAFTYNFSGLFPDRSENGIRDSSIDGDPF
jgi:iron complex outermembrane recepter protein